MSLQCPEKTMTCEEACYLVEGQVEGVIGDSKAQRLQDHLDQCEACRAHSEELLAARVLREAHNPAPPEDLADNINRAALTYLRYQNRPIHQKALGSPAFFATCASLLCGAVICLLASMRVASAPAGQVEVRPAVALAAHQAAPETPEPAWVTVAYDRATDRFRALLVRLPGSERSASLVALYPRQPVMVNLRATGPARLEPANLGHTSPDPDE